MRSIGIIASSIQIGAGFDYFGDDYAGGFASYGMKKIKAAYAGSCLRVRRTSDSTEQDIGFASNILDVASLETFCAATDGYVVKWYDQSGNTRDLTQATTSAQPKIVTGGTVIKNPTNNLPTLDLTATDVYLQTASWTAESQPCSYIWVMELSSTTVAPDPSKIIFTGISNKQQIHYSGSPSDWIMNSGTSHTGGNMDTNLHIMFALFSNPSSYLYKDNVAEISAVASGTNTMDGLTLGARNDGVRGTNGYFQEFHMYDSDQIANRTGMYDDLNAYY